MTSVFRGLGLFLATAAMCLAASAQDLGSSNKLFGGTPPPGSSKSVPSKKKTTRVSKKPLVAKAHRDAATKMKTNAAATKTSTSKKPAGAIAKAEAKRTNTGKTSTGEAAAGKIVDARFKAFSSGKKRAEKAITGADRQRYEKLIQDGADARRLRNYAAAENSYSQARALIADDPRALNGLGAVYADRERWEDAETAYRAAVEIDPKDASSQIALSYVLAKPLAVNDLFDRYDRSERAARAATELAPKNSLAFDQLGTALELKGMVGPETENAYRRAKELDPGFAPAYAHLGRLLRRRGMTKESDAEYQRAIELAKDVPTRVLVAEVMQSELRFDESEKLLRNAVAEDPRNYHGLLLLGRALSTQKKFDESEQMLKRAADLSPNSFTPSSMLASIYLQQGKVAAAETALFNAQRSVPISEKGQLARQFESVGDAYQRIGKRPDAERCYRTASALNKESRTIDSKLTAATGR